MKKILSIFSITVLSLSVFAGCGQNAQQAPRSTSQETPSGQVDSMLDNAGNAVENAVDTAGNALGNTVDTALDAITPDAQNRADQTSATNKGGQPSITDKTNTQNFIGEDKAKQLALDKAGVSAGDVIFDRTELDNDNGVWVYEIEFKSKTAEYDAEIKAEDGSFLEWEVDKY